MIWKRNQPDKEQVYQQLRGEMLDYTDYANKWCNENDEPLVPVPETPNLTSTQYRKEMLPYTGEQVYVRRGVARQLGIAAALLAIRDDKLKLEVCYGYRALEIQRQNFEKQKALLSERYSGEELLAATHRLVAMPEVAGHPAGAAVDIRIVKRDKPLNFGTDIWEFVPDSYTFSPYVSKKARRNRILLRSAMIAADFAPYDGEWWHFSYGDKEWAQYYGEPFARYGQVEFSINPAGDDSRGDVHSLSN